MGPLDGVRILDLTQAMAGPLCTMFLAGMGAEVIKIEPPWGELSRLFPPLVNGISPYISYLGRNKKGVTLNLKHPKAVEIFKKMVKRSDVVVENYSPGTMDRLGLGWETLKETNPNIIFSSISGFGQYGPWSSRRSFDPIAQASSGYMWLMKEAIDPDGLPLLAPEAIGDTIPGLCAALGIVSALYHRQKTGKGQWIDVAQMDAMISVEPSLVFWSMANTTFKLSRTAHRLNYSGLYKAKDAYVMISLPEGQISDRFRELAGKQELSIELVAEWVENKTVDEVVQTLSGKGIPISPVLDLDQVLVNDHAMAREMVIKVDHPQLGEIDMPGFPIKFSETKGSLDVAASLLGECNSEVYSELLGLSEKEVHELKREGVI
jgi:crotonobetainyl-CoA:carnitine CoA-transferase CaiB-like acyl-CoA transferase